MRRDMRRDKKGIILKKIKKIILRKIVEIIKILLCRSGIINLNIIEKENKKINTERKREIVDMNVLKIEDKEMFNIKNNHLEDQKGNLGKNNLLLESYKSKT